MKTMDKLIREAEKRDLKIKVINDFTVNVYNPKFMVESWIIELDFTNKKAILLHQNSFRGENKSFHKQREVNINKYGYLFDTLEKHPKALVIKLKKQNKDFVTRTLEKYNIR